jgi:hypothetical protein
VPGAAAAGALDPRATPAAGPTATGGGAGDAAAATGDTNAAVDGVPMGAGAGGGTDAAAPPAAFMP